MDSSAEEVSTSLEDSSRIRTLFYLGEAMMAGSLLTIFSTIAIFLVVYLPRTSLPELLGVGAIGLVFLVLTARNVWALREATDESRQPPVYQEWMEVRQWRWVITGALLVCSLLVLISGVLLELAGPLIGKWTFQAVIFLVFGTLISGLCIRIILRHKLEKNYPKE